MREEILSIQYLRGFAALLVVFHHSIIQLPPLREQLGHIEFGQAGVDVFFVISGFVIYVSTFGSAMSPLDFLRRRIARVAPLYWLATLLVVALALVAPRLFATTVVTLQNVVTSLLFIPSYSAAFPDHIWPLLVPGWSLNFEMFFYAVFTLAMLAGGERRAAIVVAAIGFLVVAGAVLAPSNAIFATYTDPRMLEFVAGVILGSFWTRFRDEPFVPATWWSIGLLPLGIALLIASCVHPLPQMGGLGQWAIPAAMIVWGALALERHLRASPSPLLELLGDASYSLYLSHLFTLGVLRVVWVKAGIPIDTPFWTLLWFIAALGASAAASVVVYRYAEIPITQRARRLLDETWRLSPLTAGKAQPIAQAARDGDAR